MSEQQKNLVDVRADGYEAAQQGKQASDCPHPRLTAEQSAWMAGFDAGLGVPVITEEMMEQHNAYVERDAFRSAAKKAIAERDALRAQHLELLERNGLLGREHSTATQENIALRSDKIELLRDKTRLLKDLGASIAANKELRAVLREILDRINADIDLEDGKPVISDELFERAEKLLEGAK